MRSISVAIGLSMLHAVLALDPNCYNGFCCPGSIVGGCNGEDISNFICCVGDPNHGQMICAGDGALTCSAGTATPLASATAALSGPASVQSSSAATTSETNSTKSTSVTSVPQVGSSTSSTTVTTSSPSITSPSVTTATSSKSAPATTLTGNAAANVFGTMPGQIAFKMMAAAIKGF